MADEQSDDKKKVTFDENECVNVDCRVEPEVEPPDSFEPDECFEEKYKGDSRKWILRDGSVKLHDPPVPSEFRDKYREPELEEEPIGARRKLLRTFLWQQMAEEVFSKMRDPLPVEPYCTEYHVSYDYGGLEMKDNDKIEEWQCKRDRTKDPNPMHMKYPLYSGEAHTVWYQNRKTAQGVTPGPPEAVFRKNSIFTTPVDEQFDPRHLTHGIY